MPDLSMGAPLGDVNENANVKQPACRECLIDCFSTQPEQALTPGLHAR